MYTLFPNTKLFDMIPILEELDEKCEYYNIA